MIPASPPYIMRTIRIIGIAALAMLIVAITAGGPDKAGATVAPALKLTKRDLADLMRIERHLNESRTIRARFLQVSSDGSYAEGTVHIQRPGRMRLEYDPPNPTMVIADGSNLIYIDRELDQATALLLSLTPAELILRETLSFFAEDFLVNGFSRTPGVIRISVVRPEDPLDGRITLVFSDNPLELRKWVITDAQGITTTVSLLDPAFGVTLDPGLFEFEMPKPPAGDN